VLIVGAELSEDLFSGFARSLEGEDFPMLPCTRETINRIGVQTAGVDHRARDRNLASGRMFPGRQQKRVEFVPYVLLSGIAETLLVSNQPGFPFPAPALTDAFEAIVLDVDRRRQQSNTVRDFRRIRLEARLERDRFDRVALFLPGFPEPEINERFQLLRVL